MTDLVVFAGPSVPIGSRGRWSGIDWRPPAEGGDFIRLGHGHRRVVLIDGYFEHRAAPFHKEILAAIDRGVEVYGASSMGALRAAELWRQGMIGVGRIFEAYRRGMLMGDDEVALVHAPETLGWAPLSIPMVELRASLLRAVRSGLVSPVAARTLRGAAHAIHFEDRDWPRLSNAWIAAGASRAVADAIERLHVPLKAMDAAQCIARALADPPNARPKGWTFPETLFFQRLQAAVSESADCAIANKASPA